MLVIGLTGGIATGKSTASSMFVDRGVAVIDADQIAREVVEPGEPAYLAIRAEFGASFFDDENGGVLRRELLGKHIFADAEKRRKLNQCTHYYIRKRMLWYLLMHFLSGTRLLVLDTPLLFEVGYDRVLTRTIVVWCTTEQELNRLIQRDGLAEDEAKRRVASQMSLEEKKERATILLDNTETKEKLRAQIDALVDELERSWTPSIVRAAIYTVIVGVASLIAWPILRIIR